MPSKSYNFSAATIAEIEARSEELATFPGHYLTALHRLAAKRQGVASEVQLRLELESIRRESNARHTDGASRGGRSNGKPKS